MINEEKDKLQEEAYLKLRENNYNGIVLMSTGTGKSNIIIRCLRDLKDEETIVYGCDNRQLRDESFPAELKKWGMEEMIDKIDRKCYQSLYKIKGQHFNVFFADEFDVLITPKYIQFLQNNTFDHIIALSATLEDEKRKIIKEYLPVVFERKLSEIEGKGIINEADFYFLNYMLTPTENRKYLSYNEAFKRELQGDRRNSFKLESIQRNRKLFLSGLESSANICRQLSKKLYSQEENKILIFCGLSSQADKVSKFSFHSHNEKENTNLKDFDEGKIRILSVVSKLDRGININGVNTVIFEAPGESKTKVSQKSGRSRRLDVNDKTSIYFLIPFYKDRLGNVKPTIVQKWVINSTVDMDISNGKIYQL